MTVPNPLLTFVPSEFNTDDGPHVFRAECKFGTVSIVGDDERGFILFDPNGMSVDVAERRKSFTDAVNRATFIFGG
jgi:hypothetical protein